MRIFFFTAIFCLHGAAGARVPPSLLHLELGETYMLPAPVRRVWIENRSVLAARPVREGIRLQAKKPGLTRLRTENILHQVRVTTPGTKAAFARWQKLENRFAGLKTEYCDDHLCLRGRLYRLQDYPRLLSLLGLIPADLHLALNVDPELNGALQSLFAEHLRRLGISPVRLITGEPWRAYLPKSKYTADNIKKLRRLGVRAELLSEAVDTADNVRVAVKIMEINKNFERKLGVQWPDQYEARLINWKAVPGEESLDLALNAAEKSGEARVLAAPTLICRDGKEAEFFAGGEFPVRVLGLRSRHTAWKRYGIGLKLKPRIDPLGQLSLSLESEVSTLDRSIHVDDMPALHTNRISSVFDLTQGRTIAISGLLKSEQSENSEGLPWLKNLPVLGPLFSSRNFQTNKSELVILVTPSLME